MNDEEKEILEDFKKMVNEDDEMLKAAYIATEFMSAITESIIKDIPTFAMNQDLQQYEGDMIKAIASVSFKAIKMYGMSLQLAQEIQKNPDYLKEVEAAMKSGVKA